MKRRDFLSWAAGTFAMLAVPWRAARAAAIRPRFYTVIIAIDHVPVLGSPEYKRMVREAEYAISRTGYKLEWDSDWFHRDAATGERYATLSFRVVP